MGNALSQRDALLTRRADVRGASPLDADWCLMSGCVGPRDDGYVVGDQMTSEQARDYHGHQLDAFTDTRVDLVSLLTAT